MRLPALTLLIVPALAAGLIAQQSAPAAPPPPPATRSIAITIDDLPFQTRGTETFLPVATRGTAAILETLKAHRAPAVGFLNENKLEAPTAEERAARLALLQRWIDAGHKLANHTYSHPDANARTVEAYVEDIDKGERLTKAMQRRSTPVYFRYPMTHAGDTAEKKAGIAKALAARGYTIAPHTIENMDFVYDMVWLTADAAGRQRLRDSYFELTFAATDFAERKARELFGRDDVPQVLVIHANALNAELLGPMLERYAARGYRFITLDAAMADKAYATPDVYVGTHGPTWLFRWSRTLAPTSDFRADPEIPAWVMQAAYGRSAR
jgi:peptidoglycan/xylan/chitin deacetylase (PgdA/CDA1 family)